MHATVVRFNGLEVNLRTRELWKDRRLVRLQDQPFQILAMMLERPGDLVTRDEIRARLWPDGTTVDFEHSVNAAIKRLRAALGETAENPQYVETLHRRGYRLIATVERGNNPSTPQTNQPRRRIVVLPFEDLSAVPAPDGFIDGLTEEMISQLGRMLGPCFGVISRTSSMALKGTKQTARDIGQAFGADYLVEGSVRRDGDRVRVTAQLIETRTETHLWTQSYDRRLEDLLAVQSEVSGAIVRSIAFELFPCL